MRRRSCSRSPQPCPACLRQCFGRSRSAVPAATRRACAGPEPFTRERRRRRCSARSPTTSAVRRNYPDQPPLIPHAIEGYALDLNANKCLSCHCAQVHRAEPGADDQRHALPGPGRQHPRRRVAAALCLPCLPRPADQRRRRSWKTGSPTWTRLAEPDRRRPLSMASRGHAGCSADSRLARLDPSRPSRRRGRSASPS